MRTPAIIPESIQQPRHSRAAIRIAEIVTGGHYGSRKRYATAYGPKTVEGIADLIDSETGLPEVLAYCQDLLEQWRDEHEQDHADGLTDYGSAQDEKKCPDCRWLAKIQKRLDRVREGAWSNGTLL
jgi:hypothetical protein